VSRAPARGQGAAAAARPRRSGPPKVRVTPGQPPRRPAAKAGWRAQIGRALAAVPVPRDLLRRVRNWTLALLIAAGVIAGIIAMGVPQTVGLAAAHALGRMGFVVRNVEIEGRAHVDPQAVYQVVMDARGQDMPLVDLHAMRDRLLALGWIADARVSRRLPDTLVVGITERVPAAILQRGGRLALVDAGGNLLGAVDPRRLPLQLPLLIGPGAERHIANLQALIASQPALGRLVVGATWIGDRRWDIRFQSGETLALPEGEGPARDAFATFARRDAGERLLGRGYVRFDLRLPGQLVVRTSREPGARVEDAAPIPPPPVGPLAPGTA